MVKRIIYHLCNLDSFIYNKIVFFIRKPQCKEMPHISGKIYMVSGRGSISFGKGVRINSSLKSNPIGGSTRTILFIEPGAKLLIGDNVGISNSAIHVSKSIIIHDDVMIGGDCRIYDTDFHSVLYSERIKKIDTGVKCAPIIIEKGVFIGTGSMILKGVTIGEKSVIAAGSIVTNSIPPNEVWGGVPAKFINRISDI